MYACRGFESIHQGHFPTTILKIDFFQNYQICQIIFGFHFFVHLSSWWSVCPRINWLNSTKHVWNGDWQIGDPRGPKGIFVCLFFVCLIFDSIQTKMFGMVICHALFFSLNQSSKPLCSGGVTKSDVLICFELRAVCSDIIRFSATVLVVVIRNLVKSFTKNANESMNLAS